MKRAALLSVLLLAAAARAENRSPLSVGLLAAGATSMGSGLEDYSDGLGMGARIKYEGGDRWASGVQWASYRFAAEPLDPVTLQPITAFTQRRFGWGRTWIPFVRGELGFSRNTSGRSVDRSNTRWTAGIGGGLQWNYYDLGAVSVETGFRHFDGATPAGSAQVADVGVVFSFYLPESWVPMFPEHELTLEDLESPVPTNPGEVDENLQTQGELNRLTQQIEEGKFPPIAFELGNSVLLTTSYEALDNVGAILRRHPEIRVRVYGFVEEAFTGTQDRADTLALARSEVVRTYLMQNFALSEATLFSAGLPPTPDETGGAETPALPPYITFEVLP